MKNLTSLVKSLVPEKLVTFFRTWLRTRIVKIKSIDELYKDIEKSSPIPQRTVFTPELTKIAIHKRTLRYIEKERFITADAYTVTLPNVIYYAKYEVLLSHSRQLIAESIRNPPMPGEIFNEKFSLRKLYINKLERISGISSVYRSRTAYQVYYHSLIDYIPRVYLLSQPQYQDIAEIKLLVSTPLTDMESFFLSRLLPQNVKPNIVNSENVFSIEKLIFPSFLSSMESGYLPKEYLSFFLSRTTPTRERKKVNRIFVSRKRIGRIRCIINEEELLEIITKYGFSRYYLEDLAFEKQIELFYDAEMVIGIHGAGLTNLIFSSNCKVLELFPTNKIFTFYYYLSKAVENEHNWLCSNVSSLNTDFYVDIKKVSEWLSYCDSS